VTEVEIGLNGCFTHSGKQGKEYGGKKRWIIKTEEGVDGADLEIWMASVELRNPHTHKT